MTTGQLLLGGVTAVAAIAAALLSWWAGFQATGQREHQARREEWWRRFQWAIELTVSGDDPKIRVGLALMASLSDSSLATADELDAMSAVTDEIYEMSVARLERRKDNDFVQVGDAGEGRTDADSGHQD